MTFKRFHREIYNFFSSFAKRLKMYLTMYMLRIQRYILFHGNIKSILIVRFASIGDVIRSSVIIEHLKKKYPNASIDFLTSTPALDIIKNNTSLSKIYLPKDISELPYYDWIVNLQAPDPPQSFLNESKYSYPEILQLLAEKKHYRFFTGRRILNGRDISPTIIYSCNAEIEEIALISLLTYYPDMASEPRFFPSPDFTPQKIMFLNKRDKKIPLIGIFIGSASTGDHDGGTRTYSITYLADLVLKLLPKYTVALFGQSSVKSAEDRQRLDQLFSENPSIINLVDKTDLTELFWAIQQMDCIVSSDSGPVHMAIGLGIPLVALYTNCSSFRISSKKEAQKYILIDAFEPCSKYVIQWKFFCNGCDQLQSKDYNCIQKTFPSIIDKIPQEQVVEAIEKLLEKNQ
jgi:ADP-heptose:LPS heptosyltransferase